MQSESRSSTTPRNATGFSGPRAHLRWKRVPWSDESTFQIGFGNHGGRVLQAKEEKDRPHCYQCKVEKPASVMVRGRVGAHGNLHICESTTNAERHMQALEQHMLPSKRCLLQGHPCFSQQDHAKPQSACVTAARRRSERKCVAHYEVQ